MTYLNISGMERELHGRGVRLAELSELAEGGETLVAFVLHLKQTARAGLMQSHGHQLPLGPENIDKLVYGRVRGVLSTFYGLMLVQFTFCRIEYYNALLGRSTWA